MEIEHFPYLVKCTKNIYKEKEENSIHFLALHASIRS